MWVIVLLYLSPLPTHTYTKAGGGPQLTETAGDS